MPLGVYHVATMIAVLGELAGYPIEGVTLMGVEVPAHPTTELELATIRDMALALGHRKGIAPGIIVWLPDDAPARIAHSATFGEVSPSQLKYLAAVALKVALNRENNDDDNSA